MLMKSGINPFDSQEAKPYKNDPEILQMTNLVAAYQNNDINEVVSTLIRLLEGVCLTVLSSFSLRKFSSKIVRA